MMIEDVLPAIVEKWPGSEQIIIQQDGAQSHLKENDAEFLVAIEEMDLPIDMKLMTQPPNSPNTNVLDLGFFHGLDDFNAKRCHNKEELI